ncbi:MAG: PD-(D/E)XK nuclease family protein [Nanoarchaeota archaeon]
MPVYSHSRLSTFETCKLKFKYGYIDKIEPEIKGTIETFMGSRVHDTLEKLYKELMQGKKNSLKDLLQFYDEQWDREWNDQILIVRPGITPEHYHQLGVRFITDYFLRYEPFDQERTVATELRLLMDIDSHQIQGFIDRLTTTGPGEYVIHDYKTGGTLPTVEKIEADRQLKLYAIGLKKLYQDCRKVKLVWHYLAFDKDIVLEPTKEQLEVVERQIKVLIEQVEATTEFPSKTSALCGWCEYKPICPEWKHQFESQQKDLTDFAVGDGKALVMRYAELQEKMKELEKESEEAKEKLLAYAEAKGINAVFADSIRAAIRTYPKLSFPKKEDPTRTSFFQAIKSIGLWDDLAMPDVYELSKRINNGEIHEDLVKVLDPFITKGKTTRIYLNKS